MFVSMQEAQEKFHLASAVPPDKDPLGDVEQGCQVWSTLWWQSSSAVEKNTKRSSLEHFGSRF